MSVVKQEEKKNRVPETPRKRVTNDYHGITVIDDYQWLEAARDPAVREWSEAQNAYARRNLDGIPAHAKIHARLKELYSKLSPIYHSLVFRGNRFFCMKWDPTKQQQILVSFSERDLVDEENSLGTTAVEEQIIFDPNQFDASFSTAIDFFVPSKDGRFVAICLSKGGSEDGSLHFFNLETGEKLHDVLQKVNYPTAGGSAEWAGDSSGIYYTRYPGEEERPKEDLHFYQQVYFHKLGSTEQNSDACVFGRDQGLPRIAEIKLKAPEGPRVEGLIASVANGDGGEFSHYYYLESPSSKKWIKFTEFSDEIKAVQFSPDGQSLLLLSRRKKDAPNGKILKLDDLTNPKLENARTLIEAREGSIVDFDSTEDRVFVVEVVGGPSKLFAYDSQNGEFQGQVNVSSSDPISSIDEVLALADQNALLVRSQSFLNPSAWYKVDAASDFSKKSSTSIINRLKTRSPIDTSTFETRREFAVSKDGTTKVPVNILLRKGTPKNGENPTILYGYGGYGISLSPIYAIKILAWLDLGGIYAFANLRGGGEYGEDWHRQGMLTKKQNVFDDFISCAQYLVQTGYTRKEKLAIEGGSNGGLLMGAALTQRPELFHAVVSHVGVYDMLRVELGDNGAFNVTEYGTVKNPEQFKALYAYSPYHNVRDGAEYPAILLLTGENDGRVDPWQSRKMAARLQKATSSGRPVLLRIDSAGHGMGTSLDQRIAQDADVFSFLSRELQMMMT